MWLTVSGFGAGLVNLVHQKVIDESVEREILTSPTLSVFWYIRIFLVKANRIFSLRKTTALSSVSEQQYSLAVKQNQCVPNCFPPDATNYWRQSSRCFLKTSPARFPVAPLDLSPKKFTVESFLNPFSVAGRKNNGREANYKLFTWSLVYF